jgi:hypothetical protein
MSELRELVSEELTTRVDPRVSAMAEAIAAKHGSASRAVLFYGSCLRQRQLEGLMLDFYLIVSDYSAAYAKRWLAVANRLIPPNVFYFEHDDLRAKYAVLSEQDFAHECGPGAWTVSTAARFAQPSRLVWSADAGAGDRTVNTICKAAPSLLGWTLPLAKGASSAELWTRAFALTFGAELRAERLDRSRSIVEADPGRYECFTPQALAQISGETARRTPEQAKRWWLRMQRHGKRYSVARLAKASATFAGGPSYIAWKINRHAGTEIALKPWQQRHPLLAAITLLPRLLRSGAVR